MSKPLSIAHYAGTAIVGVGLIVLLVMLFDANKTLPMDIIITSDLSGLFLFVGAVIGITSKGQPFKHRYAQMSLFAGLGMALIDFFLTGMKDVLGRHELLTWIGNSAAFMFYSLMVMLVCGTYLAFSLPDRD